MNREQQNQQNGKPEVGHGNAELGQAHQPCIAQAVVVRGGVHASGQGQYGGQRHGQHGQRHGERQALDNQVKHGAAVSVAHAPVTHQQTAQPVAVALQWRAVQPELAGHGLHGLGRGVGAHHHLGGIARQQVQHQEHHHGGAQQGEQEGQQTLQEKPTHGRAQRVKAKPAKPTGSGQAQRIRGGRKGWVIGVLPTRI